MKAILISIRPQHTCNILNYIKLWEIRKKFPKDYVGWVYIYCTKEKPNLWLPYEYDCFELDEASQPYLSDKPIVDIDTKMNGKVVARFWCDKVELIEHSHSHFYFSEEESKKMLYEGLIERLGCISADNLHLYLKGKNGTAIHITKLEIFDKPKEISEFMIHNIKKQHVFNNFKLTRAPQSWCYVEA